jgi:hypothetical protein
LCAIWLPASDALYIRMCLVLDTIYIQELEFEMINNDVSKFELKKINGARRNK